jgi:hypothetical protein
VQAAFMARLREQHPSKYHYSEKMRNAKVKGMIAAYSLFIVQGSYAERLLEASRAVHM